MASSSTLWSIKEQPFHSCCPVFVCVVWVSLPTNCLPISSCVCILKRTATQISTCRITQNVIASIILILITALLTYLHPRLHLFCYIIYHFRKLSSLLTELNSNSLKVNVKHWQAIMSTAVYFKGIQLLELLRANAQCKSPPLHP